MRKCQSLNVRPTSPLAVHGPHLHVHQFAAAHDRCRYRLSDAVLVEQATHVVDACHGLAVETNQQIARPSARHAGRAPCPDFADAHAAALRQPGA